MRRTSIYKKADPDELRPRMKVWDVWYPSQYGQGKVVRKKGNLTLIRFPNRQGDKELWYDKQHIRTFIVRGDVSDYFKTKRLDKVKF